MIVHYYYRGPVERMSSGKTNRSYDWKRGYSEYGSTGRVVYPWMTKTECRLDALKRGCSARFIEEETVQ
jgi:hypothetical protein